MLAPAGALVLRAEALEAMDVAAWLDAEAEAEAEAEAGEAEARAEESSPGETAGGGGGGGGGDGDGGLDALAISPPAAHQQKGAPGDPGDPAAGDVPGVEWGNLLEEAAQLGGDVCHLLGEQDSN